MSVQTSSQFGEGGDEIDLGDIGRTLRRQWRKIAFVTAVFTLLAVFLVLFAKPSFTIQGSLYFGEAQLIETPQGSTGQSLATAFEPQSDVPTAVDLIQSRALVEQAILETGLNASVRPFGAGDMSYWKWRFLDGEAVDAYRPSANDVKIMYATIYDQGSTGDAYVLVFDANGAFRLLAPDGSSTVLTGVLNQPAAGGGVTMLVKMAQGDTPPAAGKAYNVFIVPAKELAAGLTGSTLTAIEGGSTTEPTQTADISLIWNNPFQGAEFINQLMRDFIATQLSWKTESASDTEQFVSDQLAKIQASLADADSKLANYQAQTGIMDVPTNASAVVNQLSNYQVQRTAALLQQQALAQLVQATASPKAGLNPYLITEANDPVLSQLANSLATAQIALQTQSVQFTAAAPEVQAQQATIDRTEEAIRTLLRNDEQLAQTNLNNIDQTIAQYQNQLKAMPAQSLQIIELTRSSDVFGQLYVLLMQNEEEAEVSKAATIVDTRIVSPAEVPLFATKPKGTITVLAGLVLGLIAGIGWVLVQRVISGRFHSENDVRRSVALPVYGLVPARLKRELAAGVFPGRSPNAFSEAFRLLRSRLYLVTAGLGGASKVVLVTSAAAGDGKTTIAANLARSLADDGRRVLLLDADLHRGHVHEALRLKQTPGLSEWLTKKEKTNPQPVPGQNFLTLSCGAYPPNPSELLNDPVLGLVFKILRSEFEYIIVDCPPLPNVADTLTLAKYADVALSVLYVERTPRSAFAAHNETFGALELPRGVVINGLLSGAHYGVTAYGDASGKRRFLAGRA